MKTDRKNTYSSLYIALLGIILTVTGILNWSDIIIGPISTIVGFAVMIFSIGLNYTKDIDPESFRGKIWLLAIDKIIIGAFIASAFLVYDRIKTKETRDYNKGREEIQLGFKRAEYVKQLVPVVVDTSQNIHFRAHALGALIETQSIDARSAIGFCSLLKTAVPFEKIIKAMPAGLPSVIDEYNSNWHYKENSNLSTEELNRIESIQWFWRKLVLETIKQYRDSFLGLLDSDDYLQNDLPTIARMLPSLDSDEAKKWMERTVKGIRILGSLEFLRPVANAPSDSAEFDEDAIKILASVIDPSKPTLAQTVLATELIELLIKNDIASKDLSLRLLPVLERLEVREAAQLHDPLKGFSERVHKLANWSYRVTEYLEWSAGHRKVAGAIETHVQNSVKIFYEQLKLQSETALDQRSNIFERSLVQILMNATLSSDQLITNQSRELLTKLFSQEEGILRKAGILEEAQNWKNGLRIHENEYE